VTEPIPDGSPPPQADEPPRPTNQLARLMHGEQRALDGGVVPTGYSLGSDPVDPGTGDGTELLTSAPEQAEEHLASAQ
jgi:hypothetical protein